MTPSLWKEYHRVHDTMVSLPAVPFDAAAATRTIEGQLAHVVRLRRDAIAILDDDVTWTYGEFDALTNRIANTLVARLGVGSEPIVVTGRHRGATIAAMYGILKAGKIIVPIDPSYPPARVATILNDLSTRLVLFDQSTAALVDALGAGREASEIEWLNFDHMLTGDAATSPPNIHNQLEDYAYVIYTSGSTGTPKGVIESHRNVLNFVRQGAQLSCAGTNERVLSAYPFYFSGAASTVFTVLLTGSLLVPFDVATQGFSRMKEVIRDKKLNRLEGTPSMWRALLATVEPGEVLPHVTRSKVGGDQCSGELIQAYFRAFPNAVLRVGYGSSEKKYIACFVYDAKTKQIPAAAPTGPVMDDTEIVIVDDTGNPVQPGELGEVILYSDYLSPGYWRRPEITAAKFGRDDKGRFYRTGDLGKLDQAGYLWLFGRRDGQLKIRGQRVETAEIEHALIALPEVQQSVVVPYLGPYDEVELAAYVTVARGASLTSNDLRRMLRTRVAPVMVPQSIMILPSMPLSSNGKPDRKLLPPPQPHASATYVAPQTPTQVRLVQLVGDLLGTDQVGMADNFFDLGGTSLLAARLTLAIQREFGVEVSPRVLLETPTLAGLAAAIEPGQDQTASEGPARLMVTVAEGISTRTPLFLFLGGGGSLTELMWYANLLRRLDRDQPIYALLAQGVDGESAPFATVDEMVTTYVAIIQARQPHGPYLLGGECLGGKLAYAVAQALRTAGEEIVLLTLLDVMTPSPRRQRSTHERLRHWQRRSLYHWDHVRQLNGADAAQYFWQRVAHRLRLPQFQSANMRRHLEARRAYRRLLAEFVVMTPLDVPVALILSQESIDRGVAAAWQPLLFQPFPVSVVPGDHRSYLAGHVEETAHCLKTHLVAIQPETASPVWGGNTAEQMGELEAQPLPQLSSVAVKSGN